MEQAGRHAGNWQAGGLMRTHHHHDGRRGGREGGRMEKREGGRDGGVRGEKTRDGEGGREVHNDRASLLQGKQQASKAGYPTMKMKEGDEVRK